MERESSSPAERVTDFGYVAMILSASLSSIRARVDDGVSLTDAVAPYADIHRLDQAIAESYVRRFLPDD